MLRNQTPAPDFTLPDDAGTPRTAADLAAGKPLLLLFFRFAGCPTARKDLLAYADVYDRIQAIGAAMAAVSVETPETSQRLRRHLQIPFPLLSDPGFAVSERYGVYRSDETDEGPQPHGEPAIFIIGTDGTLAYSQVMTGPKGLANPSEMALLLLYMVGNGGRYW